MRITVAAIFLLTMGAFGQNISFQHDGLNRQYRIHVPENIHPNAPLVIALHGYSGNNNDMISNYGWVPLADERGFVVACPNGTFDQFGSRIWDVDYDFHPQLMLTTTALWSLWPSICKSCTAWTQHEPMDVDFLNAR